MNKKYNLTNNRMLAKKETNSKFHAKVYQAKFAQQQSQASTKDVVNKIDTEGCYQKYAFCSVLKNIEMIRGSQVKIFFLLLYFYQSCLNLPQTSIDARFVLLFEMKGTYWLVNKPKIKQQVAFYLPMIFKIQAFLYSTLETLLALRSNSCSSLQIYCPIQV